MQPIRLWLDDCRQPPEGWTWVKKVSEAIQVLKSGPVEEVSLDHDLGWCSRCPSYVPRECPDHLSGYRLVQWMARERVWPRVKPLVHSSNPVGAQRMREDIDRYWVTQ